MDASVRRRLRRYLQPQALILALLLGCAGDIEGARKSNVRIVVSLPIPDKPPPVDPAKYLWTEAKGGLVYYTDRTYVITSISPDYVGWYLLRTANDDKAVSKDPVVTFTVPVDSTVVVGYDVRGTAVAWLNTEGFVRTGHQIGTNDTTFDLWKRMYRAGERVSLGPNNKPSMYIVLLRYEVKK